MSDVGDTFIKKSVLEQPGFRIKQRGRGNPRPYCLSCGFCSLRIVPMSCKGAVAAPMQPAIPTSCLTTARTGDAISAGGAMACAPLKPLAESRR
jgi:hypothetical protein